MAAETMDTSSHRTLRGHLRWVLPLVMMPVLYFGGAQLFFLLDPNDLSLGLLSPLSVLAVAAVTLLGPLVCAVFVLKGIYRVLMSWRRSIGIHTSKEKKLLQDLRDARAAKADALALREQLLRGQLPPPLPTSDVIPAAGERLLLRGGCRYLRYYGQTVNYSTSNPIAFGRPTFVTSVLVASAISNASARSSAAAQARAQWREDQIVETIVSTQRIRCRTAQRGWLNFDHAGIVAIYPDLGNMSIVLEYEVGDPLFLHGQLVPSLCMVVLHARMGLEGLRDHPSVRSLQAEVQTQAAAVEA